MTELLAPAGNISKLKTAVHFGADAVYFGGKAFGLRAYSDNFSYEDIASALDFLHKKGKKGYITVNIFPKNADFIELKEYLQFLQEKGADGVIVSDPGVVSLCKSVSPKLEIHLSTQANTLNKYSAKFWEGIGIKRLVLARELSVREIAEIREYLLPQTELEVFVHGAMCISYSGRCLLSNYLSGRDSNRGECVQACRWQYDIREHSREGDYLTLEEDKRGTYILNSRDLMLIRHLDKLKAAGVHSFKIEGRMKSEYYVGTVVNSYRRAIDDLNIGNPFDEEQENELYKTAHRAFTSAYFLEDGCENVNLASSTAVSDYDFIANVLAYDENRGIKVKQRNRFKKGDELEILSNGENHNKKIIVDRIEDEYGNEVEDAKLVEQILYIKSKIKLCEYDMLRKKKVKVQN